MMDNFRYFAFQYLNDWYGWERQFVAGLSPQNDRLLRLNCFAEVAKYYSIARNFKRIDGDEAVRYQRAIELLDAIKKPDTNEQAIDSVNHLAEAFRQVYGFFALSASSKLLWLRYKSPVLILDSDAINGLRQLGARLRDGRDYRAYCDAWRSNLTDYRDQIAEACDDLMAAKRFTLAHQMGDDEVHALVGCDWFRERVFDYFLCKLGRES